MLIIEKTVGGEGGIHESSSLSHNFSVNLNCSKNNELMFNRSNEMLDIKRKKELSNLSYAGLAQKIQWGKNQ
jgi:hypothetical protein